MGDPNWDGFNHSIKANRYQQTFINGYLDVSGRTIIRHGDLSLNHGNLFVGGNLVLGSGGRVGIGSANPTSPLHVISNSNTSPVSNGIFCLNENNTANNHSIVAVRTAGTSGGNPFISFDVSGSQGYAIGIDNADFDKFKISSAWDSLSTNTRMTITSDGRVGIGTANPSGGNNCTLELKQRQLINAANYTNFNNSPLKITGPANNQDALFIGLYGDATGDNPTAYIQNTWDAQIYAANTDYRHLSLQPTGGYVGIGTLDPEYTLHVLGSKSATSTGWGFYSGADIGYIYNWSRNISIRANNAIWCDGYFTGSDKRIKNNIRNFDALELLNKLNPVVFSYIDRVNNIGDEYGFIAQEFDTNIFQSSIIKSQTFIPNVYELANINNLNIIVLQNKNTNDFEKDSSNNIIPKLKLYDASNNEIIANIVSIIDDKSFQINKELNMDKVFVYGQEVSDYHILKKDEIITVVTGAVQEQQ